MEIETTTTETESPSLETSGSDLAPEATGTENLTAQQVLELEKLEKFKFGGKEWTPQELRQATLMQADYTRKTKEIAQEKRFYENLPFDLDRIRKDPNLVEQFRQIYPKKFHRYIEGISGSGNSESASGTQTGQAQPAIDPALIKRIQTVESKFEKAEAKEKELEVQSNLNHVETSFAKLQPKYPYADPDIVVSKAIALADRAQEAGDEMNLEKWGQVFEKLFKAENEKFLKSADAWNKQQVKKQLDANRRAKDMGAGGGTPGQAPKKMLMKDARTALEADL